MWTLAELQIYTIVISGDPMEIFDLHENFGAVISGVKLKDINDTRVSELRPLLIEKGFLLFREQCLDDHDIVKIGQAFGNGALEPSARKVSHGRQIRDVVYLSNLRYSDGEYMGFPGNTTDFWHSDQEFRENPAILASIYCVLPSPEGGETSFASTDVQKLNVATGDLQKIKGKWSTRVPAKSHDNVPKVEVAHPAILTNPISGKDYVYVSENLVRYIDIEESESHRLKATFMEAILAGNNVYSHQWQPGDYALYDNGQVIHRREAFEGPRLLKASKIYADPSFFAVPDGYVVKELEDL